MFISSYTTIHFFVKNFFSNDYISVNTIFECSYFFFWLINRPSIKCVRNWGNGGRSSKMCTSAYRGMRGVTPYLFFCFCLVMSCFICRNLTLPTFKKSLFVGNGFLSPMRSVSVIMA